MLDLRIMNGAQALPLFDLPTAFGREQAAREIGNTIDGLIAFLDDLGGDPDLEDSEGGGNMVDEHGHFLGDCPAEQDEDREPDDDAAGDQSWPEWDSRGRHKLSRFGSEEAGSIVFEDDEDDDPDTGIEDDPLGCDPEEDLGAEEYGEIEQMTQGVPSLAVYALERDPSTGQRRFLGYSNMQSSFVCGTPVRSADSGAEHRRCAYNDNAKLGEPV